MLVDGSGFSLYDFTGDGFDALTGCQLASNVSPTGAPCTSVWTPVLATGPLDATSGVIASQLGTKDGPGIGTQVTYAGERLYRFVKAPPLARRTAGTSRRSAVSSASSPCTGDLRPTVRRSVCSSLPTEPS